MYFDESKSKPGRSFFSHHLICLSIFITNLPYCLAHSSHTCPFRLTWPRPHRTNASEKDKKRKHARNANNGQVIRLNIKTHSFSFRPSRQFERTSFLSSNLSGTLYPTWSRRKRGRRCPGTDGKTLY